MDTSHHHDSNTIIWSFESLGNGASMIKQESGTKSEASSSSSVVLDSSPDYFVCGDNDQLRCSSLIDNNLSAISSSASDYAGDVYSCATASTHHGTVEMDRMIFDEFLEIYGRS